GNAGRANRKLALVVGIAWCDIRFARSECTAAGFADGYGTYAVDFLALRRARSVQPCAALGALHRSSQRHQRNFFGTAHISPPLRDGGRGALRHLARAPSRNDLSWSVRSTAYAFPGVCTQPLQRKTSGKANPFANLISVLPLPDWRKRENQGTVKIEL